MDDLKRGDHLQLRRRHRKLPSVKSLNPPQRNCEHNMLFNRETAINSASFHASQSQVKTNFKWKKLLKNPGKSINCDLLIWTDCGRLVWCERWKSNLNEHNNRSEQQVVLLPRLTQYRNKKYDSNHKVESTVHKHTCTFNVTTFYTRIW